MATTSKGKTAVTQGKVTALGTALKPLNSEYGKVKLKGGDGDAGGGGAGGVGDLEGSEPALQTAYHGHKLPVGSPSGLKRNAVQ